MEESLLDLTAHATAVLLEKLPSVPVEEHDDLFVDHIKTISSNPLLISVLNPKEECEWVYGINTNIFDDLTLSSYCKGKVALLDFFTYCCINCQHILPDLHDLEELYSIEDGFAVVGVHSAKFEAERLSSNVSHAVERLNINHPVLNDGNQLWNRLGVHCWPTLVLLDPEGKPIFVFVGEGHRNSLFRAVAVAMKYYRENKLLISGDFSYNNVGYIKKVKHIKPNLHALKFPGKVTVNPFSKCGRMEPWLTISDSGNNRIVIIDFYYQVTHIIGGLEAKLQDGNFEEARFNNPQGICWLDNNVFIVCDTGNHVLRKITLDSRKVDILAGTGIQSEFGDQGGLKYCQQSLSSPWDVILYKTPDMVMSVKKPSCVILPDGTPSYVADSDEDLSSIRNVLLVAAAGSHQIWAVFLNTTIWWKFKTYTEGTVIPIIGSGREENRNNRYPNSAGLAQPSGLALFGDVLYIADSESSTIRHVDMKTGQVASFVGGDRNPSNLFAYGDMDGKGYAAKLQHPLGICCDAAESTIFIADTYNHKIKSLTTSGECTAFYPLPSPEIVQVSEPGGLCFASDVQSLIVADTNNHRIMLINVKTRAISEISIIFPKDEKCEDQKCKDMLICPNPLNIAQDGGELSLNFDCFIYKGENNLHLTPGAPQRWKINLLNLQSQDVTNEFEFAGGVREGNKLPGTIKFCKKKGWQTESEYKIRIDCFFSLCETSTCTIKKIAIFCQLLVTEVVDNNQCFSVEVKILPDGNLKVICREIN